MIWEVRNGTDGFGVFMFHVYAADFAAARARAADNLRALNYPATADNGAFTVHGIAKWAPDQFDSRKLHNTSYPTIETLEV